MARNEGNLCTNFQKLLGHRICTRGWSRARRDARAHDQASTCPIVIPVIMNKLGQTHGEENSIPTSIGTKGRGQRQGTIFVQLPVKIPIWTIGHLDTWTKCVFFSVFFIKMFLYNSTIALNIITAVCYVG